MLVLFPLCTKHTGAPSIATLHLDGWKSTPLPQSLCFCRCLLFSLSSFAQRRTCFCFCRCFCSCFPQSPGSRHLDRSGSQPHHEPRSGETPAFRLCTCGCPFYFKNPLHLKILIVNPDTQSKPPTPPRTSNPPKPKPVSTPPVVLHKPTCQC